MLRLNFKLAFRNLLKQRQTTLISIIGLVIAFSVILQIGRWTCNEMIYDRYNSKADRIYRFTIDENYPEQNFHWHFARNRQPWRIKLADFYPEIESLTEMRPVGKSTIKAGNNLFETEKSFAVDSAFFNVFDFNFIEGNSAAVMPPNTVIVSESFAKKLFPNQDAMYKEIELSNDKTSDDNPNGFLKHTITGIFKDLPATSHFHVELLTHYRRKPVGKPIYGNDFAYTYILLKKGTNIEQIKSRDEQFKKTHVPEGQRYNSIFYFTPLKDIHLKSQIEREIEPNGDIRQVKLFIFIGLGILFIALINYINLSIASFEKRSKCFYLNLTAGARLKHNILFLLTESLIIAVIVSIISAIVFEPLSLFLITAGVIRPIPFSFNVVTLLIGILFPLLVIISGILPILIAKLDLSSLFTRKSSGALNKKTSMINNSLLILQFTISIVVIICSLIMNKQNNFLFSKELGHNLGNIVMVSRDFMAEDSKVMTFKEDLLKIPDIKDVSMCMDPPGYLVKDQRGIEIADIPDKNKDQYIDILPVDGNFFSFFKIPLIAGSEKEYITGQQYENYILNESAIKKLGFTSVEKAIGTKFKIEDLNKSGIIKGGTITGVAKDFNFSSLYNPIQPTIYFQKPRWQFRFLVKMNPGDTKKDLAGIKQVWERVFPDHLFNYQFLDDVYGEYYSRDITTNKLVGWFSVIGLILSSIGLWGISQISVIRKTKLIGICKVNGARISEVMAMLNRDFVKWVTIAFVIACPVAWTITHQWLENFAYKTEVSWWIFAGAGLLAVVIALVTVSRLTWKAANRNPVEALRYE